MPGRDSIDMKVAGMYGVPRHIIEEKILSGGINQFY